jgi:hypothetical protein
MLPRVELASGEEGEDWLSARESRRVTALIALLRGSKHL